MNARASFSRPARRRPPRLLGIALAVALASALLPLAGSADPVGAAAQHQRQAGGGIYWGAQIGEQLTGAEPPWDMRAVFKFNRLVRKNASLLAFSAPFARCGRSRCSYYTFPTTPMEDLREQGMIPVFNWSSSGVSQGLHDPRFRLSKIIRGRYDGYIRQFATAARDWGHPFFLRFNWEMNGDWFPWSEGVNRNRPGQFVRAWRHVHRIFTAVGATNATWVWCPNVGYEYKYRRLYPGNRYVDWTCLDGYNWGRRFYWSRWQSFDRIFRKSYRRLLRVAPRKPVMVGEVASTSIGGSKPAWIKDMLRKIPTRYRRVHALIWFDVNDRGTLWPLERSRHALRAFARGIARPVYRSNVFGEIAASPIPPPGR